MSERNRNIIKKQVVWDASRLSAEDAALSCKMDEFFRAEMDITDVKSDPEYAETDRRVKVMISAYQKKVRNADNETYIRDSLDGNGSEEIINEEIREIKEEIKSKGVDEISSEWVREWHNKRQANGGRTKEIREFITSSFEESENRSQQQPDHKRKTVQTRTLFIRYISAAAAILAGVIFAVNALIPSDDPDQLFEKYYEPVSAVSPITRSASGNVTGMWASAVNSYNSGDYYAALAVFSGLMSADSSLVPPRFFLGMTHLSLGNYSEALSFLKEVADKQGEYSKEAKWYLGLVYLKEGDKIKASECFNYLAQSHGYYSERAEKILRRIR
jgi:TolA-binding protein